VTESRGLKVTKRGDRIKGDRGDSKKADRGDKKGDRGDNKW